MKTTNVILKIKFLNNNRNENSVKSSTFDVKIYEYLTSNNYQT